MGKRWLWLLGPAMLLCGLLLWLYSHRLWSGSAEHRLDSLLARATDTTAASSTPPDSLRLPAAAQPMAWITAEGNLPRCERCIAIALIGIDARLHDPTPHADANHVLLLDLRTGRITIVAIPRDTPADAGFPDTSQYNRLANVRAHRGLQAHLATLAALLELPSIDYYVELGFSQAFALLRLLHFEHPSNVLRILRARTGVWGDDFHRVAVQAQFIRQQILRWFSFYDTPWGLALLRAGLGLVRTNLTVGVLARLADSLRARGFPADTHAVSIAIYGIPVLRTPVYDFSDPATVTALAERLRAHYRSRHPAAAPDTHSYRVRSILNSALTQAQQAAKHGRFEETLRFLTPLLRQRPWWQLDDPAERSAYRQAVVDLASRAYEQRRKPHQATTLRTQFLQHEEELERLLAVPVQSP